jgi:GntR family transcriptional regulator
MIPLKLQPIKGVSLAAELARQLKHAILAGKMERGERLPSVRELSGELSIHPLTIAKAYATLENEGLVETRWGKGTFVKDDAPTKQEGPNQYLKDLIAKFIDETLPLASGRGELRKLFEEQLRSKR